MKKLLPLLLLILIGCSEPEPIDYEMLVKRGGLYYKKNTNEVYSGPVFNVEGLYSTDLLPIYGQGYIKKGKRHGKFEFYRSNGQLYTEYSYKDGLKDGIQKLYYKNGQLFSKTTWKDNLPLNSISYSENGLIKPSRRPRPFPPRNSKK